MVPQLPRLDTGRRDAHPEQSSADPEHPEQSAGIPTQTQEPVSHFLGKTMGSGVLQAPKWTQG